MCEQELRDVGKRLRLQHRQDLDLLTSRATAMLKNHSRPGRRRTPLSSPSRGVDGAVTAKPNRAGFGEVGSQELQVKTLTCVSVCLLCTGFFYTCFCLCCVGKGQGEGLSYVAPTVALDNQACVVACGELVRRRLSRSTSSFVWGNEGDKKSEMLLFFAYRQTLVICLGAL